MTPIRTLFVANRGEIARRIARTCERLGIEAVVPATTPVASPGPDDHTLDLLDAGAVVEAALAAGADALHPGYGFLAESADFAEAVATAGLRWVGPPAAAIRALGDKAAARRLAASLGVPVLPGYDEADQSDAALAAAARRLGPPLLVKPSAGGGGKGMRLVRSLDELDELPAALAASRREARAAFGDERLVLERHLDGPRHVEVQVLFDAHGNGVHLGERDCSVQRRHQKVLEEAPSPAVDEALRARLGQAALRLASAVGYASAGTVEFLLDDSGAFHFLEMNTRLQVEHPVTELVIGRDLVADQLRIAAGEPLGFGQAEVDAALAAGGHAVEARLYAEDADAGFLPATGRIAAIRWPTSGAGGAIDGGGGVRVDAGVDAGDEVSGRFDPLLAKLIAHGPDRATAFDRLREALDGTVVLGLTTNLRFLRWLVRQAWLRDGDAQVDTLERAWPAGGIDLVIPDVAWRMAAKVLVWRPASAPGDPWSGGWRLNAAPFVRLTAEGLERSLVIEGGTPETPVGGGSVVSDADGPAGSAGSWGPAHALVGAGVHVDVDGRSVEFRLAPPPDVDRAARSAAGRQGGGISQVISPMPGGVIAVHVGTGTPVAAGDPVATLEAMKMEHVVTAPAGGAVVEVRARVGDQVVRGQLLAVIEPGSP